MEYWLFTIFITLGVVAAFLARICDVLKRIASALEKLAQKTEHNDTSKKVKSS